MLHLPLVCVGVVGLVGDGGAAGDGDGGGVALGCLLVVLAIPMVWVLAGAALVAGRCVARVWLLAGVGWLPVLI